ncbi:MAG: hypothetical protein ABIG95_04960 [Candidatus Woesearchaeota archaeon]
MTELIACLSTGKGTWMPVVKLINCQEWDKVFLVATDFAREKFKGSKPVEFVVIDPNRDLKQLVPDIKSQLDGKIRGTEIALNLNSGTGKEHMAVLSAVLKLGVGIRLVNFDNTIEEI